MYVYVMPLVEPNLESKKRMRVVDLNFIFDSQETLICLVEEVKIQDLTPFDDFDQPLPPPVSSRVSGESIDHMASNLKFTFVSAEVMARYLLAKEKLRKDLRGITLEDHEWHSRSLHQSIKSWMLCIEWF
jgi:hypothetical protein